ncbi:hypothetical protein OIDMADRAFT_149819 [Oidiodendron maius Zn]|uniref:Uncharacterized protein n=1 Tax=Oidiodendron maius (strain Zn) TaxID=913774 RepID=A0A0C3CTW0_OIDMZ|nr:hypothetical protein OIDMADRAFT_149819 [Oidiodendron maius Zn]
MTGYNLSNEIHNEQAAELSLVRHHRVEIHREGGASSNPIVILEDPPPATVAPDPQTPPQSPPRPLKKRRRGDSYKGMVAGSLSRTKRDSSSRHRGGSGGNTAKIDSLSLPHDPTSRGASRPDEILSALAPATLEEQSPQLNNDTKHKTVSKETQELYLDHDAIPVMSDILQKCVKYYRGTADIREGDCFVTTVHKGIGAIMKPPDLTSYFDRSMWTTVKQELRKEQAGLDSLHVINMWKESFRYDYVVKLAGTNAQSHQRENPGSAADPSQAETEALKELVDVVSRGRSEENYRKHHQFWIFLHQIRVEGTMNEMGCADDRMLKEGMMHILLFRTAKFNKRFFNKTKASLLIVRKWNQVYHPYMKEVQMRVLAERADDFSGGIDLRQEVVLKALNVSLSDWVNGARALNQEEQQLYLLSFDCALQPEELSPQNTKDVLRFGIDGQSERNKAVYICLMPYEGPCNGKRKFDGTPASGIVVVPCPVAPILPGDFLGVMSGQLRYTPESTYSDKAITGPDPNLWLDFSKITGKLSCMRLTELDREANVTLTWKAYNNQHGPNWRIDVVASKEIWPFEELVRPNSDSPRSLLRL